MVNRENYLLVKEHLKYLGEVEQLATSSLKRCWFYLRHLLLWAGETALNKVVGLRPTFPVYLTTVIGRKTKTTLSKASQKKMVQTAKRFFLWAKATYSNQFKALSMTWINTLRSPKGVYQSGEHEFVTLDEVIQLIKIPIAGKNLALLRDKAAAAMLFLSGMRATAFTTLPIEAVDITNRSIKQWPELGVKTKNSKKATTFLLPIPELIEIVKEWDEYIRNELPPDVRWYSPIDSQWGEQTLSEKPPGKNRHHALAKRIRLLFETAGLPYKSPHKFRHGHAVYGLQHARTMADYKAVSMNLMHNNIKTTDQIYAPLLTDEVGQRIAGLASASSTQPTNKLAAVLEDLQNDQLLELIQMAAGMLSG